MAKSKRLPTLAEIYCQEVKEMYLELLSENTDHLFSYRFAKKHPEAIHEESSLLYEVLFKDGSVVNFSEFWSATDVEIVKDKSPKACFTSGTFCVEDWGLLVRFYQLRIKYLIDEYAYIDGEHHKRWLIDQILRTVLSEEEYETEYGSDVYWDSGIAP